jgi:capsular exopolysaccharide synthesis family protein
MDKLEKALQKARLQREQQMQLPPLPKPQQVSPIDQQQANMVRIHEGYLERYHVIAHHLRSKEADLFRILRTQVLQIMAQSGYRTLGITSANYGDGKTTVALNLAVSIALDQKQTVLLADLDLRKPSVTEYLGIEAPFGISDYFTDNVPLSQCLIRPSFDRLNILPAGRQMDNSSEVLGSPKIAQLAHELKTRYADRIIIYDMPPTLAQDDPLAFLPHVDAVLLVINDGVTRVSEIKQSMNVLAGANVIGTVLNNSASRKTESKLGNLWKESIKAIAKTRKIRVE